VVDNWSGASLLPTLLKSLSSQPRQHTYVFIGFTDEEKGLVGSRFYTDQLTREQVAKIDAMVNLDSLGLSPTKIWVSHAAPKLVAGLATVAKAVKLPVERLDVDNVGSTDSESFARRKVPCMTVHSVTQETFGILHSAKDQLKAIHDTYHLVAAYLAYLDQSSSAAPADKSSDSH
jgi:Zn-dependent M28 family amino/carboxypeptidase